MTKKILGVVCSFLILGVLYSGFESVDAREAFDVKDTEAILISATSLKMHDKPELKGDEAMLITDKAEIAKFVKLFDGNAKAVSHACGYHWRITFVRKSAEPTDLWFNQNCEEFEKNNEEICDTVQAKFSRIRKSPTHFVTEIGIDAGVSPDEALRTIREDANFDVFVLGDLDRRFPFVEIEATAVSDIPENRKLREKVEKENRTKAESVLTEESKHLGKSFSVLKNGDFKFKQGIYGGVKIEETLRMKIFFEVGTKLDDVEKNLKKAKFIKKSEPQVYFLQLVSENRFSESYTRQLSGKFPFIKEAFAFTSYPR